MRRPEADDVDDGDGGDDEDDLHHNVVVGRPVPKEVEIPVTVRATVQG